MPKNEQKFKKNKNISLGTFIQMCVENNITISIKPI